jgi:hypothetical protein
MTSPWDKEVSVHLDSVHPLRFRIDPTGTDPLPTGPDGELIFDNKGHEGFHIHFNFTDHTGNDYVWPQNSDKDEAVWSKVGTSTKCPGKPDKEVFHATGINGARTRLTVHNPNRSPKQGAFKYTLCVTKDEGQTYLPLDPGGINNNGAYKTAKPPGTSASTRTAVAVIALVAIAAFAMYEFGVFAG